MKDTSDDAKFVMILKFVISVDTFVNNWGSLDKVCLFSRLFAVPWFFSLSKCSSEWSLHPHWGQLVICLQWFTLCVEAKQL